MLLRLWRKKTSAVKRSIGSTTGFQNHGKGPYARLASCLNSVLNVKALVGAFNQEKALVGAFSVIVKSSQSFV